MEVDITPGENVSFYQVDVTSSPSISAAAQEIRSSHGDPTVLINNAGIGFARRILDESEDEIRKTIDVNLLAHFLTVKEFMPSMVERNHGHVVTVASMASFVTIAQNVTYSATKAGVLALHEGLRQELDYRYNAPNVRTRYVNSSLNQKEKGEELMYRQYRSPYLRPYADDRGNGRPAGLP